MIKRALIALMFIVTGSFGMATVTAQPAYACGDTGKILTLKPWYYGIAKGGQGNCTVTWPEGTDAQRAFVWTIALNIVEDLIQITGFIAVGFVIYGGFMYMISTGETDKAAKAKKMIINALVGAVIAGSAILLVNLVARTALGIKS